MKKLIGILLMLMFVTGCTTLADARRAEGEGVKHVYKADFDTAWGAITKALEKYKLAIATESKSEGYFLAQNSMSLLSYGENVAIFAKRKAETTTEIEIVSKRVLTTNVFASDWSKTIHGELAKTLPKY
jgi:uncharacterized lipoprotein